MSEETKQPEALRLADEIEWIAAGKAGKETAAELRRLYAENERKDTIIKSWLRANSPNGWIDDLRMLNQELLEALNETLKAHEVGVFMSGSGLNKARAAIAKAQGEKK